MISKLLDGWKQKAEEAPALTKPSSFVNEKPLELATTEQPKKRRWSYVTYLDQGTLHGDGDNLMVGL